MDIGNESERMAWKCMVDELWLEEEGRRAIAGEQMADVGSQPNDLPPIARREGAESPIAPSLPCPVAGPSPFLIFSPRPSLTQPSSQK